MSAQRVLGSSSPVETARVKVVADKESCNVEVEGTYSALEHAEPLAYVPTGYTFESSTLSSTGDGMGKLSIRCIKYESGASFGAERTTFSVQMSEVSYDLWAHPYLSNVRETCVKWVNDGCIAHDGKFYVKNLETEAEEEITDATAKKFCRAYRDGIHNFIRYFPVIEKVSVWKNPPGLNRSGKSFTGGTLPFSNAVGKFDAPPITLSAFASANFFKSSDTWAEEASKTWRRTEQWTYTPDGPQSDNGWIYQSTANE